MIICYLGDDRLYVLSDFVATQEIESRKQARFLQAKIHEAEHAVKDLCASILRLHTAYRLRARLEGRDISASRLLQQNHVPHRNPELFECAQDAVVLTY